MDPPQGPAEEQVKKSTYRLIVEVLSAIKKRKSKLCHLQENQIQLGDQVKRIETVSKTNVCLLTFVDLKNSYTDTQLFVLLLGF